jgi:hypothetical protein
MNVRAEWKVFDADNPILTFTYSFGAGAANSLAVGTEDGLLVVSPPCTIGDDAFDALARFGAVRALVAPNAFHHLGLRRWRERYPQARVFAPAQSLRRVQRQTGMADVHPLSEAARSIGPAVELIDMPHYRTGELLVRVRSRRGLVWYLTDIVLNLPEPPAHPVARLVFALGRSAPGLRFNNVAALFMVKDKAALKRWLAGQAAGDRPGWLLLAHGDAVDLAARPGVLERLFAGAVGARTAARAR